MKNNYNPFTVPENFFESAADKAVKKYRGRRHAIHIGLAAMAVACVLVIPMFVNQRVTDTTEHQEMTVTNLADMYEYDIFLQVNFAK